MADDKKAPIIVKKIIKKGGGHHGGAWKVAYADFVTAMMAFFLLLWLLSTSSKATLEGIAEYFTPTTGIKDAKGIGFKGGTTSDINGIEQSNMATPGVVTGATPVGVAPQNPDRQAPTPGEQDDNLFQQGSTAISQAFQKDPAVSQYANNISISQTPEGLKIDIRDSDQYPMFETGSAQLTVHGQKVLGKMAELLDKMPNYLSITGHTDASPAEQGNANYSNWELSSDRAQAARRFLLKSGMNAERPQKVTGMADKELILPSEPRSPQNRRITLLMLRGSHVLVPDSAVPASVSQQVTPPPKSAPAAAQ